MIEDSNYEIMLLYQNDGEYIADLDTAKIKKFDNVYTAWDNDNLIITATLDGNIVDRIWTNPKYRGQGWLSKMLWYFKTRENISPIQLGNLHSADMQEVVKRLSRFKKYWTNGKEIKPFSLNNLDDFYDSFEPTEWRLMLENNGNFEGWPRYNGVCFMRENYDWQIQ